DVGQDCEPLAFLDQTHGNTGNRLLQRDASVHQSQRGTANGSHRGRAVGLGDLGDDAQRVRELLSRWQHRTDCAPCELAVTDFATTWGTHETRLSERLGREV